jgi:hypothetical protein
MNELEMRSVEKKREEKLSLNFKWTRLLLKMKTHEKDDGLFGLFDVLLTKQQQQQQRKSSTLGNNQRVNIQSHGAHT